MLLNKYSDFKLTVDGLIGNNTINAIKEVQRRNSLVIDGIAGKNTYRVLQNNDVYMDDDDWAKIKYFKKSEFKCGCKGKYCDGYPTGIYKNLVYNMESMRIKYGKPITITSGLRCQRFNNTLTGATKGSKHISGRACDFYFSGMNKTEVIKYCKTLPYYNYAYTNNTNMKYAVHLDIKG